MATDETLILQAMRTEPERGFRLFMARYKEPVYWHIRRLTGSHADAEDAAQETFVRIFRALDTYRGDSSFTAWVYRIATNEALRLATRQSTAPLPLDNADTAATRLAADAYVDYTDLEAVRLQQAIRSLPAKQQLAFNLRYYDELDYAQIGEIAGTTPAGAKANYHLAKEKIIQYMNSHD